MENKMLEGSIDWFWWDLRNVGVGVLVGEVWEAKTWWSENEMKLWTGCDCLSRLGMWEARERKGQGNTVLEKLPMGYNIGYYTKHSVKESRNESGTTSSKK